MPGARIQSLARMDAIFEAIGASSESCARLSEIATRAGLHKSTAYSLLETLVTLGYVVRVKDGRRYAFGPRLFELGRKAEARIDLISLARPLMFEMVGRSRESVSLAVPATFDAVIVSTVEGTYSVRGARWEGRHVPFHASAVGKAMLAFMEPANADAVLASLRLDRRTRRTILNPVELRAEMTRVREVGFAISLEEEEDGANAVAPLVSRMNEVKGAIAIWGPASRLSGTKLERLGPHLAKSCGDLLR